MATNKAKCLKCPKCGKDVIRQVGYPKFHLCNDCNQMYEEKISLIKTETL